MTFVNTSYLFGLFAIAIPIVIHLFDLQKPKKIIFNNVALLKSITQQTSSARKVKEWLILLSRILAIIFLIFALAQPNFKGSTTANTDRKYQIFVDNSPSMQVQNLLNESLKNIDKWTQKANKQTKFRYIDQNFLPKDNVIRNATQLKDRLSETAIVGKNRFFSEINKKFYANNLAQKNNNITNLFFSDFQKSYTLDVNKIGADTTNETILIAMANKTVSNVYIDSVWTENIFVRESEKNKLFVALKNTYNTKTVKLKFKINNIQTGLVSATIDTKSTSLVSFNFELTNSKPASCELIIENDEVTFDNKYYFVLYPTPKVKVLNITNSQDSYTKQVYTSEKTFEIIENKQGLISQSDMKKSNFIVVDGFDKLKQNELETLKDYVAKGKQVLAFPSENATENTLISSGAYFGWQNIKYLNQTPSNESKLFMAFPDVSNPFFKNIFEKTNRQADMPFIKPIFQINEKSNILLKSTDNEAFVCYKKIGNGLLYLCNTPLYQNNTNLMRHAIFVPFMYKMALTSIKNSPSLSYSIDSKWIKIPYILTNNDKPISFVKDNTSYIVQPTQNNENLQFELPPNVPGAGIYSLILSDSLTIPLALNIPKNESILEYYSKQELQSVFKNYKNIKIQDFEEIDTNNSVIINQNNDLEIWKYCLLISLLFLLIEIALIRYFK